MAPAGERSAVGAEAGAAQAVSLSVVVAGGGTAGHVFPGLAFASALVRLRPRAEVSFIGTRRGIEVDAVPAAGFPLDLIEVTPYARTIGPRRFLAPASLVGATRGAAAALRARRANVVVGMGGYASLPVAFAARRARLPIVLHEQNASPGLANLVAARLTPLVALGFEEARGAFPRSARCRLVGNPIRQEIASLDRSGMRGDAAKLFGLVPGRRTVLVVGGSLGASRLNRATLDLARRWAGRDDAQILLAAGRGHGEQAREEAASLEGLVIVDFIERMDMAYAAADLAVARSGAASVAELACAGLPAILVPYPYARRNHQRANAEVLARTGAAVVLADSETTGERLDREIAEMVSSPDRLERMGAAARGFARPRAAEELAAWALEVAGK